MKTYLSVHQTMNNEAYHSDLAPKKIFMRRHEGFTITVLVAAALAGLSCAMSVRAAALRGLYTEVAAADPDFGSSYNAGGTLGAGLVQSSLGPNGLPVLSASGITRLGTGSDMNPTTYELLWWSAGADPYVSLDANPVQVDSMPLNYGYPNVNWYPTGQTGDNNFFRTVQWQGTFNMATAGSISLSLAVDDDAWLFIDGTLVAEDHYGYTSNTSTPMSAGTHSIKIFYDDRFPIYDAIQFSSSVPLSPVPEPGTMTLFIGGAILLLVHRSRRTSGFYGTEILINQFHHTQQSARKDDEVVPVLNPIPSSEKQL